MCNTINALSGIGHYDADWEMEFQIQLGPKLYPEYPVKSIAERFAHLKQALNLPDWGLHSIGIDYKHYISNKFIILCLLVYHFRKFWLFLLLPNLK